MGYGLPSAIGVKIARPHCTVVDIDGDASFCMTGMGLVPATQHGVGVKVLILNNSFQGMVKQWQGLFYGKRYSGTPMFNPDFTKLAEPMGFKALCCSSMNDLPNTSQNS
ncbi:unnamed protein product [Didymodactylos carnosus]|uniref:2-hydroxyacyl-CoA lyase 2 n=1 Tax=Didymodactylos carnosus TaxID=1234261 RepID=A0A8S2HDB6_9BILA|nr:unnamed protein product [Didymodactylos carnosus]CAF3632178.1 unnamed protein product [Didymodactylos carnosus]